MGGNANEIVPTLRLSYHDDDEDNRKFRNALKVDEAKVVQSKQTHRCCWNRSCSRANECQRCS
ncbi:hypothetical protein HanXRQr2_Chr13g0618221 [Helianthus annuus]|uniref:Uncharacterized protein n=1 Tax=Helianthus annuus TaxID=4232 RepID=A0A9K3HEK5_HELAN|nr:hypothetical protein HanXRQr2_Chr13g0618221 [Helianthus annuus]